MQIGNEVEAGCADGENDMRKDKMVKDDEKGSEEGKDGLTNGFSSSDQGLWVVVMMVIGVGEQ